MQRNLLRRGAGLLLDAKKVHLALFCVLPARSPRALPGSNPPYFGSKPRREASGAYGETGLARKALRVFKKQKRLCFPQKTQAPYGVPMGILACIRMLMTSPTAHKSGAPASPLLVGKRRSDVAVLKIHGLYN